MTPELEIVDLVEDAIMADLLCVPELAPYLREHDSDAMKGGDDPDPQSPDDERLYIVTISAEDRGTFNKIPGIQLVGVTVEIERNLAAQDQRGLGKLAALVANRMPATQIAEQSRHQAFSNDRLKVEMITGNEVERRTDQDLTRVRTVAREFVCRQLA